MSEQLSPSNRRIEILLFLWILVSYGYFHGGAGWNHNARLDAIFAFVEPGTPDHLTFKIDRFIVRPEDNYNTGDWSYKDGHYYSNKAPGPHLLGIPIYFGLFYIEKLLGINPTAPIPSHLNTYLLNLTISVLPLCVGIICFFRTCAHLFSSTRTAAIMAIILALCTPLWPYSTQLWGHPTATAAILVALYGLVGKESPAPLLTGFMLGIGVLSEYTLILVAVFFGVYVLWNKIGVSRYMIGAAPPALAYCLYHYICFGSPITLAVAYNNPIFIDDTGALGILGSLNTQAIWELTFGFARGLFHSAPVLILALFGFYRWWKSGQSRSFLLLCLGAIGSLFLVNITFNGWHGGSTVGPRYLIATLPFWILGLQKVFERRKYRVPLVVLGGISFLNSLAVAATSPTCGYKEAVGPLYGCVYPRLLSGELGLKTQHIRLQLMNETFTEVAWYSSWNLGEWMGLSGVLSILPLLAVTIAIGVMVKRVSSSFSTQP